MKVKDCMTKHVICVSQTEPLSVAARLMARYNIGVLPVRRLDGRICGMLTDRDLVLRCMAPGKQADALSVQDVMSNRVISVSPQTPLVRAVALMKQEQVRRLPVVEDGRVVGLLSLGDLTHFEQYAMEAAECLEGICSGLHRLQE